MKHELFVLIPQSTEDIIVNNELDIGNPPPPPALLARLLHGSNGSFGIQLRGWIR
jgi:hypothetical protein